MASLPSPARSSPFIVKLLLLPLPSVMDRILGADGMGATEEDEEAAMEAMPLGWRRSICRHGVEKLSSSLLFLSPPLPLSPSIYLMVCRRRRVVGLTSVCAHNCSAKFAW